jgi:membrane associated rhomboid family serine protease
MIPLKVLTRPGPKPYLTFGLIIVNILVFIWELSVGSPQELNRAFQAMAFNPCSIGQESILEVALDALRSMFFHGGWAHLIGNMVFLWLFGSQVEGYFGRKSYLAFYFAAGLIATLAHWLFNSGWCVPAIGASGAISGVLAAFFLLYPGVKIKTYVIFFRFIGMTYDIPALYLLGYWFIVQMIAGIASLGATAVGGGIAFWAHIGGFIAGLVLTFVALMFKPAPHVETTD